MNIKKELQKYFPYHTIHHIEAEQFADEQYYILYDKGKKLCLQLHSNVYIVYARGKNTVFAFPDFRSAKRAIAFMRLIYLYTKWLT